MCSTITAALSTSSYLSNGVAHILVNSIGHLCSLHSTAKLHVQDTRVVSQPPVISFVTCQTRAVDTRLLTCTDTDNLPNTVYRKTFEKNMIQPDSLLLLLAAGSYLSIFGIADRVGLGVLDSDGGHSEVTHSFLGELENRTFKWSILQVCCVNALCAI